MFDVPMIPVMDVVNEAQAAACSEMKFTMVNRLPKCFAIVQLDVAFHIA